MMELGGVDVFFGDLAAVTDLSFSVGAGEIVALVGANGAGKSTTLAAISGLVPLARGDIRFEGESLRPLKAHEIVERGIVHIPENRRLFPFMTVRENLEMGAYSEKARPRRRDQLEFVYNLLPRLRERSEQFATTLSGGEQQMCAIGRGLMSCPRLLMLDEPTLGLAPLLCAEVFVLIRAIRDQGIPILLVEQQVVRALEVADRGHVIESGRLVMSGTGRELLADDGLRRAYLGI